MNKINVLIILVINFLSCNIENSKIDLKSNEELVTSEGVYHFATSFDVYKTWEMKFTKPNSVSDFEKIIEGNPWRQKHAFITDIKREDIYNHARSEENRVFRDTCIEESMISLYQEKEGKINALINCHLEIIFREMVYDTFSHWIINELRLKFEHHPEISISDHEAEIEYDFMNYASKGGYIFHKIKLRQNLFYGGKKKEFWIDSHYIVDVEGGLSYSSINSLRDDFKDNNSIERLSKYLSISELKLKTTNLLYDNAGSGNMQYIELNKSD